MLRRVGAAEDLQRLELLVGRVVAVEEHRGARAPAWVLTVELGSRGTREASMPRGDYAADALVGRQIVGVLDGDGLLVLGAHSHAGGVVLLAPDSEVEDGTTVA
jgi:tRNA-binding protein